MWSAMLAVWLMFIPFVDLVGTSWSFNAMTTSLKMELGFQLISCAKPFLREQYW